MAVDTGKIQTYVDKHHGRKDSLIAVLQEIQSEHHYLPQECLRYVSKALNIPLTDVVGVATFYRAFSLTPRGKHICTVCMGTACHVRGGPKILEEFERRLDIKSGGTTPDAQWSLETVACLGCCAIGPVVVVDGDYHAHTNIRHVPNILKKYQRKDAR